MRNVIIGLCGISGILVVVGILGFGGFAVPGSGIIDPRGISLSAAMSKTIGEDPRNADIKMSARYRGLGSDVLVIDLDCPRSGPVTPADLFRATWGFASRVTDTTFSEVHFDGSGKHIFTLSGAEFKKLGVRKTSGENPIFVIRTFPEKLTTPEGKTAFPTWTGGLLGVVGKQMGDFSSFAHQWCAG